MDCPYCHSIRTARLQRTTELGYAVLRHYWSVSRIRVLDLSANLEEVPSGGLEFAEWARQTPSPCSVYSPSS